MQRNEVAEKENTIGGFIEDEPENTDEILQDEIDAIAEQIVIQSSGWDCEPAHLVLRAFEVAECFVLERDRRHQLNQSGEL